MIWYAKSQTLHHHLLEVMIFSSPLGYKQSCTLRFFPVCYFSSLAHEKIMKFIELLSAFFSTLKLLYVYVLDVSFQSYAIPRILRTLDKNSCKPDNR